jgi:enterochelin esterase-like enzyme
MKKYTVLILLLLPIFLFSQQANVNLDYNPQKNTEGLIPFSAPLNSPDVDDNGMVTFSLKAPGAKEVLLPPGAITTALGENKAIPFTKGDDGIWKLTIGPLSPDMYAYHFLVDGVQITDPSNTYAAFTAMPPYSQLIVHGKGPAYYDAKNVPHGNVVRHIYHSDVTGGERELYVYTPPGYDREKVYPVLYLLGGSGELPSNWIYDGRVNFIMDNLLAEKKAVPMLIVVPNNQVIHRNHPQHTELTFDIFEKELRNHVIPLIDQNYRTIQGPKGRAISGLSMGGRHSMFVGFRSLDLFANFGILSAGDTNPEESLKDFLNDPDVNNKVDYLFVGQGTKEASGFFNMRVQTLIESLTNHQIKHDYYVGGQGGHDWNTWRHLLYYQFLPNLFRNQHRVVEDGGTGGYPAIMYTDNSLPTHTIFRPLDLSTFGEKQKLPIIAWGNGACANSPWEHINFLSEVASHGFLAIAIGPMPQEGERGGGRSTASQLLDAIDWAIAQNSNPDSPLYNKIDITKIAVSGMSCGGLQTLEVAPDPRVTTAVICNSGIIGGGGGMPGMPALTKDHLQKLHTPTLYLLGGESDIAYGNGMDDYERINHVPVFVANMDVGHGGTYSQPHGGEFARVATAWYKWQLKGDKEAGKMFTGKTPLLSLSHEWKVDKKNLP